jgi:3',5'-cyclic AMP phosphodiesterase CpdA
MALLDLKQGDADDDRLSPGGKGLRAIVLSTLFEFNFLQGLIAFLLLVILPALLVGLLPSIARTYGALLSDAVFRLRDELLPAATIIAVCGLAAYWWGASLLKAALHNVWQLHYTLIFPIFVLVRELIKLIGESFLPWDPAPEALQRRRRLGTILAGILFAVTAFLIAAALLYRYGIVSVSLTSAPLRTIVEAALIDGSIILALSTVVASLFWTVRELSVSTSVTDLKVASLPAGKSPLRIAHLSDPHIVGGEYEFRMEPGTRGPRGNARLRDALNQLHKLDASGRFDSILITGDITDAGTRAEWIEFLDLIAQHPQIADRILIIPGNHDVNIGDRSSAAKLELPWSVSMALRKLRVLVAVDSIQGTRVHVFDHETGKLGPTLHDFLRSGGRQEQLTALAAAGSITAAWRISRIWRDVFPMIVPPASGRPGIVLMNSSTDSHMALMNAIGVVDPRQISALAALQKLCANANWLVVLHHQVVEYPSRGTSLKERAGLCLVNAPDLLAAVKDNARKVLILHGHRHRDWLGSCGGLGLCSAPSVTLGAYNQRYERGAFHVHELTEDEHGNLIVIKTDEVSVG